MKSLVLTAYDVILILSTAAYSFDPYQLKLYYQRYYDCAKELNWPADTPSPFVQKCEMLKNDYIDEKGAILKEKFLDRANLYVSDPRRLGITRPFLSKCIDDVMQTTFSNDEKISIVAMCVSQIHGLADKLEDEN